MERRSEPRSSNHQLVWLTVFGENEFRCRATTIDRSGRGMKLMVAWRVPQDATVKIEIDDSLYLGEVCYCRPENGGFLIGIEIDQVLAGLSGLAQLRRKLTGDSTPEALPEHADTAGRDYQHGQLGEVARTRI